MIDLYLNQTATLGSRSSVNTYNEPTRSSSTIPCRFQEERKMIRNAQGEEVVSNAQVFTTASVIPGDEITFDSKTWQVIAIRKLPMLDGTVNHYEVFL